ncbi:MAG: 4Fe-4S dicluster domain-containing protein, partial [Planctomycetota bacterium]
MLILSCEKFKNLDFRELGEDRIEFLPHFCEEYKSLAQVLQNKKGHHQVIFLVCSRHGSLAKAQKEAQKAGLSPLGIEILEGENLSPYLLPLVLKGLLAKGSAFHPPQSGGTKAYYFPRKGLSRREFFSLPAPTHLPLPVIQKDVCQSPSGCRQCQLNCPHEAFFTVEGRMQLDREKCTSCGHCITLCPHQALDFPRWSYSEMEKEIQVLAQQGSPLLFTCQKASTGKINGWIPIILPCQAYLQPSILLGCLAMGAPQVAVYSCGDQCKNERREKLEGQIDFIHAFFSKIGISKE